MGDAESGPGDAGNLNIDQPENVIRHLDSNKVNKNFGNIQMPLIIDTDNDHN